jgi:subtilisin family serine protease
MIRPGTEVHAKYLMRQVERIADRASDGLCRVIVQMEPSDEVKQYVETSAEIMRRRRSIVSARELVPPRLDRQKGKRSKKSKARKPQPTAGPMESYFRSDYQIISATQAQVRRASEVASQAALRPLLTSDWTKSVIAKKPKGRGPNRKPTYFWSARAAAMELTKDELRDLPIQLPMITDIVPNRRLHTPPVTKAAADRPALTDYKGYTWGISRSGALSCWGAYGLQGEGVKVAVLDTGVDLDHPDLKGKIAGFAEFDDEGNIVTNSASKAYDSDTHGTHCAGTIVGGCESGRWIGMAPGAKILAGLVLKNGSGTDAQILAGIEWAMTKGADVISLSLGGLRMTPDVLDTYTRAIINANRLGIPVVVAVGNEGSQTSGSPGNDYFAFTVGATDVQDRAAGFSGGRTQIVEDSRYIDPRYLPVVFSKPDVTAPGVDVYSSVPGKKWEAWNGTSMATPHVAGALALLLSEGSAIRDVDGSERVDILQNLLISTVKELGESGQNHRFGYGRIDALRAMGFAEEQGYI